MGVEYACEKLMEAVYCLATGTGSIQERLAAAAQPLIRLKPRDFPDEELCRRYTGIIDDLTFEDGDRGRIAATLKVTNNDDGREIAKRILSLYHALDRIDRPL